VRRAGLFAALAVGLLFSIFPMYWLVISAFKTRAELFQIPPTFWPHDFTFENFQSAFGARDFDRFLLNSLLVAGVSTAISLVIGSLAAYSLARFRLPWKLNRHVSFWILSTRMVPPIVAIVPLFVLFGSLGLVNTYAGLIIAYGVFNLPFVVWMMMGFFRDLPVALEEAALVDGDHNLGVLYRIVLPLVRPALAATAIFTLILAWNEFLFALILMSSTDRLTLPVGTAALVTQFKIIWGDMLAAATVAALPILAFTLLVQRHLVRGLTMGAVKG
jgi:multiple sugar transport system permease protein